MSSPTAEAVAVLQLIVVLLAGMRSTRIGTALASPWHPAFEPHVPPRFRKSAHLLSSVFKHDSSLSKQAYKTRERLARCSSLEMRRLHGLLTSFRAERSNAHQDPCPAAVPTQHACDSPQQSALALAPSGRETLEVFHTPSASDPDSSWGFHTLFQSQAFVGT